MAAHTPETIAVKGVAIALLLAALGACGSSPSHAPSSTPPLKTPPPVLVVTHADAGLISILDTTLGQVVGRVSVGGKLGPATLAGNGERLFVAVPDAIAIVNVPGRRLERMLTVPGEHSGLVSAGDRLYVVQNIRNKGRVLAIDIATGRIDAEREIDDLTHRPEVSTDGGRLYVPHSFYSGRVTILDTGRLSVSKTLTFEDGPTRVRLSPDNRTLFVPNGSTSSGRVTVVDTTSRQKTADIVLEDEPTDVAISLDGKRAVVPLFRGGKIALLDLATGTVTRTVPIEYPIRLTLSPDDKTVYVLRNATNRLAIIDLETSATTVLELDAEADDVIVPDRMGRP